MRMLPEHPSWEEFIARLSGGEGINTRFEGDSLKWSCDHSDRMVFNRYVLAEFAGVDVEESIAWFRQQGWRCDCRVILFSDATEEEKRLFEAGR
jgi:hypothetical protein